MVQFRSSPIHGWGGFASTFIHKGTRIVEYRGEKIDKQESLRRCALNNPFLFYLNSDVDIDGDVAWNPARLINHSCAPNCEAELIDERIWIVAARDIQSGEELTFNYGYDLENFREYPCACGTRDCVGFIVAAEFHEHVRRGQPRD